MIDKAIEKAIKNGWPEHQGVPPTKKGENKTFFFKTIDGWSYLRRNEFETDPDFVSRIYSHFTWRIHLFLLKRVKDKQKYIKRTV